MSPRSSASQNKTRLIAIFICTVVLALTFYVMKGKISSRADQGTANVEMALLPEGTGQARAEMLDEALFIGLRHASANEVKTALPEANGKAGLLVFSSRLCHDCQRLAPVLSYVVPKHPGLFYRKVDIIEDRDKAPALFRTFKPVSVPMLVFIDARGEIRNVLYNYQTPEAVQGALQKLEKQSVTFKLIPKTNLPSKTKVH